MSIEVTVKLSYRYGRRMVERYSKSWDLIGTMSWIVNDWKTLEELDEGRGVDVMR